MLGSIGYVLNVKMILSLSVVKGIPDKLMNAGRQYCYECSIWCSEIDVVGDTT